MADSSPLFKEGDIAWMLTSTAFVWLMIPGVGYFYSGMARSKNALSLIMFGFLAVPIVAMQWFIWGYSLAFSRTGNFFIGNFRNVFFINVRDKPTLKAESLPEIVHAIYQGMFAAITPALALGSAAERARMLPLIVFIFIWSTLVYDVIAAWIWSANGWYKSVEGLDFAGGTPVHISSGAAALAYCVVLGKRHGHGRDEFKPHNIVNVVLGTVFLWFGWFGFNGGSAFGANTRAAMAIMVTNTAASFGGLAWMLMDYRLERKFSALGFCSGADSSYLLCLFKQEMRIPKRPLAFSLSSSSPFLSFQSSSFSSPSFSSSPPFRFRFNLGVSVCCISSGSHNHSGGQLMSTSASRTIAAGGLNQMHSSCQMEGSTADGKTLQSQEPICNSGSQDCCVWSTCEWGRKIDIGKQIFCNRSLNMKNIVAVGFDMDYTLAQYIPETFESLAYNGTIRKLVYDLGYPPELLEWTFDWKYMVRGLVLDKKRGNILKMDRHKYVKVAYHGFREMSKEDKIATYGNTLIRDSFDEPDYALIDTLFSLAEAYLFAQLVDFKDRYPEKVPDGANYGRMYRDVRAAVDLCHRDGTLKQMVAKDPGKYINQDLQIVPMLRMLRDSGRATFLVTNSLWDYTNVVMNFLCEGQNVGGNPRCSYHWLENFDVVITGSSKPSFFHEENRSSLFEVETESGMLLNTDNGTLLPQIGNTYPRMPSKGLKKACRVFQGGSVAHLHKLLSIEASSQVLYVGDHIYGDILRSKKVLGWRTMLVVPELEREVELLWESRDVRKKLRLLRKERDLVEDKIHHLKWSLKFEHLDSEEKKFSSELSHLESQRDQVRFLHQQAQRECHQKFHKVWGQLMKTGYQNSRFAHQVERFACLYTSQVTNLSLYSPDKYYRTSEDFMPHEFDILAL